MSTLTGVGTASLWPVGLLIRCWDRTSVWVGVAVAASTVADSRRVTSAGRPGVGCSESTGLLLAATVPSVVGAASGASSESVGIRGRWYR